MFKRYLAVFCLTAALAAGTAVTASADTSGSITMESCGAYLFEWRPVDYGNGQAFAILVGGNTLNESDVILNRGYDYAYTFDSSKPRPWGQVPELVNINGLWGIPENWAALPAGSQPTTRMILVTNNKNMDTNERYVDIVSLPAGVDTSTLPPEVRKYLINVDGSDAGAYNDTLTAGWEKDEAGRWFYRKADGTFVTNSWLTVDEKTYYMNWEGVMLADTITPDGIYVNPSGERTEYMPGWVQDGDKWRYVMKNGYYAANTWIEDVDGKWYHFDMAAYMEADTVTVDGYYVDANGVWDGQASNASEAARESLGPGAVQNTSQAQWEQSGEAWRYKQADGSYVANAWFQAPDGKWYYFGADSIMLADTVTPDGYYVDASGAWDGQNAN